MGSGQSAAIEGTGGRPVRRESDEKAEAVKSAIGLDWHHPTRVMEDYYQIVSKKPIGRGHFADVYLGQAITTGPPGINLEVGQLVAVKYVYRARCTEDNLHKEVDALLEIATRSHPNVVALLDGTYQSTRAAIEIVPFFWLFDLI